MVPLKPLSIINNLQNIVAILFFKCLIHVNPIRFSAVEKTKLKLISVQNIKFDIPAGADQIIISGGVS